MVGKYPQLLIYTILRFKGSRVQLPVDFQQSYLIRFSLCCPLFSLVIVNNTACHSSVFAGNSTNENIEVFRRLLDRKIDNRILSGFFLQQARRRSSVKLAYRAFLPLPGFFLQWKKTSPRYHRFPLYVRFAKKKKNKNKTTNLRSLCFCDCTETKPRIDVTLIPCARLVSVTRWSAEENKSRDAWSSRPVKCRS